MQVLEVLHSVNLPLELAGSNCLNEEILRSSRVFASPGSSSFGNLPLELAGSNCLSKEILRGPKLLGYHQMKVFASPNCLNSVNLSLDLEQHSDSCI